MQRHWLWLTSVALCSRSQCIYIPTCEQGQVIGELTVTAGVCYVISLTFQIMMIAVAKGQLSQSVQSRLACCRILGKIATKFEPFL